MKDMGMDAYRFSISWTRILPDGTLRGGVNREGIKFYNNLIDELLSKGVQPFVTLFHWDSPQGLEDKYGGFLSPNIIVSGYAGGVAAPGRCSPWEEANCSAGDSGREPYIVSHHQILAHAEAVRLYKQKYKGMQKGKIGIALVSYWATPLSGTKSSVVATKRAIEFMLGWFLDPLSRGDYPQSMKVLVGNRLPQFTRQQSKLVKGAFDFIGINYYSTNYAYSLPPSNCLRNSYSTDAQANLTGVRNGVPIGPQAASPWLYVYPQGLHDLLLFLKEKYHNPTIYITENGNILGFDEANNKSLPLNEALKDDARIDYHRRHLDALLSAIREGANVKGYFVWSLLDNFEWESGYTVRFGLHFVDYNHGLKRYPKRSAGWFKNFLNDDPTDNLETSDK
ncbi:beta-glucosidase 12-like [Triticum urartu]|uniref:beta-glucosidase 12-like n=1 Tax=Triticum urartu TaxID=4572 RepID=UPI002044BBBD|nr:beta-glucosidase 12-like [Triticum urartu]